MRIGIFTQAGRDLDAVVAEAVEAEHEGFSSFWIPQVFNVDALTALALAGRATERIELGTAVVPIQPRHPQMLAGQALTVQAASKGRLTLGIGLSHQLVVEHMWGLPWERPVRRMKEYLDALQPMLAGEHADVQGDTLTAVGNVEVAGADAPPVLVAALGPQMLRLAARQAAGTVTWCTGATVLASHTVPVIRQAADDAGRPAPQVVAALPVCLTGEPDEARAHLAQVFSMYGILPSYRAMLDKAGVDGAEDIAIVGDEDRAFEVVTALRGAGVTDFVAVPSTRNDDERARTMAFLRSLL